MVVVPQISPERSKHTRLQAKAATRPYALGFTIDRISERHFLGDPGERDIRLCLPKLLQSKLGNSSCPAIAAAAVSTRWPPANSAQLWRNARCAASYAALGRPQKGKGKQARSELELERNWN